MPTPPEFTHAPSFIVHPPSFILAAAAMLVGATLAGCGTLERREGPPATRGGYYLDDGPGENTPADLDRIPDAVPKLEPLQRAASRPYTAMGRTYTPMTSLQPYKARGLATWYGRRYHGKQTSSGERYDMYSMSAAHATLPIPSYARVTNLANGKSVVVRINDRGPFLGDRLIDLSYAAAYKLGILGDGSARVEVESVLPGGSTPAVMASTTPRPPFPAPESALSAAAREPGPAATPLAAQVPEAATSPPEIPVARSANGVYLQLGAFGSKDNADSYLNRVKLRLEWLAERVHVFWRDGLYRVHAGPYASQTEARHVADRISQALGVRPMVLVR